jgi:tetratricopeptide (TPR) repeat protein
MDWFSGWTRSEIIACCGVIITGLGVVGGFGAWILKRRKPERQEKDSSDAVARELASSSHYFRDELGRTKNELLETQQQLQNKELQIRALKDAVEGLREIEAHGAEAEDVTARLAEEAEQELRDGNPDKAKGLFRKIAEQKTGEAEAADAATQAAKKQAAHAYRRLGALAFYGNTQEAIEAYRKSTILDPDNADIWNQLGHLLVRVGEMEKAASSCRGALSQGTGN